MAVRAVEGSAFRGIPVPHCNPEHGTAENQEIGDQCRGGIRWNVIDPYLPWRKHEPYAQDGQVNTETVSTALSFMGQAPCL